MGDGRSPGPTGYELRVFGGFDLRGPEGRDLGAILHQPSRQALLVYLALASPRGFQRRDILVALFWPERDEAHARNALSQAIHVLRRGLGTGIVVNRGPEEIGLDADRLWCDAVAFETALAAGRPDEALELYRGDLLRGFFLSGTLEFERWLERERDRLRARAHDAAWDLARRAEETGDAASALRSARRAVALAPDDERSLRGLVSLLDRAGDRAAAMHAYEEFVRRLKQDYDTVPSPETQALVRSIRERTTPLSPAVSPAIPAGERADRRVVLDPSPPPSPPVVVGRRRSRRPATRLLLAALVAVLVSIQDQGTVRLQGAPPGVDLAIAVLPFRVVGPETELWREGMVDLLSTNLDGVAGMRAIDPRVVLSRWRAEIGDGEDPANRGSALQVAGETGARYALMGTLVGSRDGVRLIGEMYDLETGALRFRTQVEGAPDSMLVLVDRLSLEILRSGLPHEDFPLTRLDLRRITTSSLPAMQAYLAGEQAFRKSRWTEAIGAFERAVDVDPTFAFAYYRLSMACSWEVVSCDAGVNYDSLAVRFADRLPDRDARLIRANALWWPVSAPEALRASRRFVDRYPDDVEGWYLYGDVAHHSHLPEWPVVPRTASVAAFARAIELDPGFGPAYVHLVPETFARDDSARARALVAGLRAIDSASAEASAKSLTFDLTFGDAASRAKAISALDTVATDVLLRMEGIPAGEPTSPAHWEAALATARALAAEHRPMDARQRGQRALIEAYQSRGRIREAAAATAAFPGMIPKSAARWILMGRVAGLGTGAGFEPAVEALTFEPMPADHLFLAALAAREERWDDFERERAALERSARDTPALAQRDQRAREQQLLKGLAASVRGDRRSAIRLLEDAVARSAAARADLFRYELGKLWLAEGDPRRAAGYLVSIEYLVPALNAPVELLLGRAYEALGDVDRARFHYARFVSWWEDCDPELEPLRAEGRRALSRLVEATRP